ncbi:MAG: glycosyltransferase family 4 protein [Opitutales bacterium]
MRIAQVTETFPPEVNGVAMTNFRLAEGLGRRGHTVTVIRPHQGRRETAIPAGYGDGERPFAEWTVPGIPIPGYPGIQAGLPVYFRLRRRFREDRPDLVHIATEGPLGWAALLAARRAGVPVSSVFHTNFQLYARDYHASLLQGPTLAVLRAFHNRCATTFVPNHDLIEELRTGGCERLEFLGRGVDRDRFSPGKRDPALRQTWGVLADDPVLLYVGRAAAEKNIPLALKAFYAARRIHPRARMVVVGDGPVRRKLQRRHPGIHFAGMRYGDDLARHYASADLFLFASTTETFGNVVTEALTSGLVVLTYAYAAGRQYIRDGENGALVPLDDAEAFIDRCCQLMESRETWPGLRKAARCSTADIPWQGIIDHLDNRFCSIIRRHQAAGADTRG